MVQWCGCICRGDGGEHSQVQKIWGWLCHHSTAWCPKGHLSSGVVVTLAWQHSTWGISADHHAALAGYTGTAGLSSDPPQCVPLQQSPVLTFSS